MDYLLPVQRYVPPQTSISVCSWRLPWFGGSARVQNSPIGFSCACGALPSAEATMKGHLGLVIESALPTYNTASAEET